MPSPLNKTAIHTKTRFALLYILGTLGVQNRPVRAQECYRPTAELLDLSKAEQEITIRERKGSGEDELWWPNQVRWARQKLVDVGALASSQRGFWQLSKKGLNLYKQLTTRLDGQTDSLLNLIEQFIDGSVDAGDLGVLIDRQPLIDLSDLMAPNI